MPDALAPRLKFGVIAPATNTIVQPEFDAMRPRGVTNQMARVVIPDSPVGTESEFVAMMGQVRANIEAALDAVMACSPSAVVCGMNAETFWEGVMDANAVQAHLEARAGVKVILGVQACLAAIQRYGGIRRISVITPYMPSGDAQVRRLFTDSGFEVVNLLGLKSNSPLLMAHESPERLRRAVREVDDSSVELMTPPRITVATGYRTSLPGSPAARTSGTRPMPAHSAVISTGARRSRPARTIIDFVQSSPSYFTRCR